MADTDTSADQKKRLLVEIKHKIEMIAQCRQMARAANEAAKKFPATSDIAAEVVRDQKELIAIYTNEIRSLQNGKTKLS